MAAYNGQRNYSTDQNFVSSYPRNNYGSTSENHSTFTRRPFEQESPVHQRYGAPGSFTSRPQQSFPRFDEQTRGTSISVERPLNMTNTSNPLANRALSQNTFTRPEFGGQCFQRPEYSGQNFQKPGFSGQNNQRLEISGQNYQRPEFGGQNYQRPEFGGQNYQRPEFSGQHFQRPEIGDKSVFRGSDLSGRTAFPRTDSCNRESFSRSEFTRDGMFSRPQVASSNVQSRQSVGSGNVLSRPMNSGNMFTRPQIGSTAGMFARQPHFDGNPMSGIPMTTPGMQFPYGGGANQRTPPNLEWSAGPNWRNRNPNTGTGAQKKPFAATQQNKPKFKPARKKSKKSRIASKLKDDGKKLKPWMTDELYAEVKKKNEMYFKAKAADSTDLWQEFRLQRNKVSSLIKDAKLKAGFLVRKKKEDEEDGKEKPYSCDTCDRAFAEESKLEEHLKEHKKCEIDGCQFEAHPKVVEIHRKLQHDTGYAAIISKLGNAAEIEKWRNERKSHFPTLKNVQKRQAEQEERFARGEVLETKDFGKFKKRRCEGQPSRFAPNSTGGKPTRGRWGRQRGRIRGSQDRLSYGKLNTVTLQEDSGSDSDDDSHITLPKFPGTSVFTVINSVHMQNSTSLLSAGDSQESDLKCISSDDINSSANSLPMNGFSYPTVEQNLALPAVEEPTTLYPQSVSKNAEELVSTREVHLKENGCSSESVAVCVLNDQNGNDQESDDEGPAVEPVVKQVETTCQVADFVQNCTEEKEQNVLVKNAVTKSRAVKTEQTSHEESSRVNGGFMCKKGGTLLEKLLANDIRHERNVILQCIRYTVNNNFFGVAGQRNSRS